MFDVTVFAVNGVQLIALVFGLTQFIKEAAGWEGKKVTILSATLGALVMAVYELIAVVPEPYGQIVGIVVASLAFGMSASGYYKFVSGIKE